MGACEVVGERLFLYSAGGLGISSSQTVQCVMLSYNLYRQIPFILVLWVFLEELFRH